MKFLDSSIIITALYQPCGPQTQRAVQKKDAAESIMNDVLNGNENVATSLLEIHQLVITLNRLMSITEVRQIVVSLLRNDNIEIIDINAKDYENAANKCYINGIHCNEFLTFMVMETNNINDIYTYNYKYERIKNINVLPIIGG